MAESFPSEGLEGLRTFLRALIAWAQAPGEAVSGELQLRIIVPEKKKPGDEAAAQNPPLEE
jgi:hypothetical protein